MVGREDIPLLWLLSFQQMCESHVSSSIFFGCLSGVKSGSFFVCRKLKITDILTRRCFELPTGLKFCFSVTCMMS